MARVQGAQAVSRLALALAMSSCAAGPGSIGAVLGRDNETRALTVRDVPGSTGAEAAGLAPGDEIVMIEGAYVKDLAAEQIRQKLRGESGTKVAVTVVRDGEVRHVKITRRPMGPARPPAPREERIAE